MKKSILLYAPVIHRGYVELLKKYGSSKTPLFLFGESILSYLEKKYPKVIVSIRRDVRALSFSESIAGFLSLYDGAVFGLEFSDLPVLTKCSKLIFADDDLSRIFVREFDIPNEKTEFVSWFLRWDMPVSTTIKDVPSDRVVTVSELCERGFFKHLQSAREQASKSPDWWRQVGSVLVRGGREILGAYNTHLPSEYEVYYSGDPRSNFNAGESIELSKSIHSEAAVIAQASKLGIVTEGAELYITTFPCPACANLIALSGIKRIYFFDGYSLVGSIDVLRAFGVEVVRVI